MFIKQDAQMSLRNREPFCSLDRETEKNKAEQAHLSAFFHANHIYPWPTAFSVRLAWPERTCWACRKTDVRRPYSGILLDPAFPLPLSPGTSFRDVMLLPSRLGSFWGSWSLCTRNVTMKETVTSTYYACTNSCLHAALSHWSPLDVSTSRGRRAV